MGKLRIHPIKPPRNNNLEKIIEEIAIENNIDKELVDRFVRRFIFSFYKLLFSGNDFYFVGIGTFRFPLKAAFERNKIKHLKRWSVYGGKKTSKKNIL